MRSVIFMLLLGLGGCAATLAQNVQDCVTTHMKTGIRAHTEATPEFYEKIVEACKSIYGGRP